MNPKVKKYLRLKKIAVTTDSQEEQDKIYEKLEELYYELSEEEMEYIETREMDK